MSSVIFFVMAKRKNVMRVEEDIIVPFHKVKVNKFPFTRKQKDFFKLALDIDTKVIFCSGPSGSTKTFNSIYAAIQLYNMNNDYDIIYVRTIAESSDKSIGSMPGDLNEKFQWFEIPLREKLDEVICDKSDIRKLTTEGIISGIPPNFVRGSSWDNKIVIFDEAQNASFKELTTVLTRIGENSKIFFCGDLNQSDIKKKTDFFEMIELFKDRESEYKGIFWFEYTVEDIMRSEILKYIVTKIENRQFR